MSWLWSAWSDVGGREEKERMSSWKFEGGQVRYCSHKRSHPWLCCVFIWICICALHTSRFFICIYTLADAVMKRGELTVCWGRRTADIWQQLSVAIWPLMTISICGKVGHGCLRSLFSLHDKTLYSVIRAELCLLTTFSSNAPESIHSSVSC